VGFYEYGNETLKFRKTSRISRQMYGLWDCAGDRRFTCCVLACSLDRSCRQLWLYALCGRKIKTWNGQPVHSPGWG